MKILCPNCRESYIIDFDIIINNFFDVFKSNIEIQNFLEGEIDQINNIINICEKDTINSINQLKNIKNNIESLQNKLNDTLDKFRKMADTLVNIEKNQTPKTNIERFNVKGEEGWKNFVSEALFNKQYKNGDIFNDILMKAALVGDNGTFWSYSSNFHLSPSEFQKLKYFFNQKTENNNIKKLPLEGKEYEIINYKPGILVELKNCRETEIGATIAKTKIGFVFGFFNSKIYFIFKDNNHSESKKDKQNHALCTKVVKELSEELISMNY